MYLYVDGMNFPANTSPFSKCTGPTHLFDGWFSDLDGWFSDLAVVIVKLGDAYRLLLFFFNFYIT